jgi:hypothetical protein
MYDKFETIAIKGRLPVGIVGNPENSEFALVDLTQPVPDFRREIAQRGFCFIGVVGMIEGVPRTALTEPLDTAAVDMLSQAYIRHVEHALQGRIHAMLSARTIAPGNDSEQWLRQLYSLKDPRDVA